MPRFTNLITAIGTVFLGWACSSPTQATTPEQGHYLSQVEATPLEFTVPVSELDASIDRTVDWLAEYHCLEFTTADRTAFKELTRANKAGLIVSPMTYRVEDLGSHGYDVSFAVEGNSVTVIVDPQHEGGFGLGDAVTRNAHILAYYIKTGELMPELIGP